MLCAQVATWWRSGARRADRTPAPSPTGRKRRTPCRRWCGTFQGARQDNKVIDHLLFRKLFAESFGAFNIDGYHGHGGDDYVIGTSCVRWLPAMPTRAAAGPCCEHWHGSCGSLPRYAYNGLRERLQATLDAEYQAGRVNADEYRAIARTEPRALEEGSGRGQEATPDRGPQQSEGLVETTETPPKGGVSDSDAVLANFRAKMDSLSDRAFAAGDGKESGRIASTMRMPSSRAVH